MAQKLVANPKYVSTLVKALRKAIPGAQIDRERVRRDRYRFIVVASKFERWGHPERQRLVWDIVGRVLEKQDILKVAMILTMSRKEFLSYK